MHSVLIERNLAAQLPDFQTGYPEQAFEIALCSAVTDFAKDWFALEH
jgi:hypothetical protein